jgi:hypothetical protein
MASGLEVIRIRTMTDLLTAHAANQPDQLAVVDDRGDGNLRTFWEGRGSNV